MNAIIDRPESPLRSDPRARNLPPPRSNHLLEALPVPVLASWAGQLKSVELPRGMDLDAPGVAPSHVYFPTTAIVSLLHCSETGAATEVAVVGHEGMVGMGPLLGGEFTLARAVVQSSGFGLRLDARAVRDAFIRDAAVAQVLLRYTQALLAQVGQTAVCNRHHAIEKQLCRWLLTHLDRQRGPQLAWTHERAANLLGVRREGVTESALKLQSDGLIRYVRGHIEVLDRPALERRACECYATVKREYGRLLSAPVERGRR